MHFRSFVPGVLMVIAVASAAALEAQGRPDPTALLNAQRDAMKALSIIDGEWRGSAVLLSPDGKKHEITQTERVGSMLDGAVKVIEGRGYEADGTTSFNAFAIVSFDPAKKTYSMRSYANGHAGDFPFEPLPDGFRWSVQAGPATMNYTTTIKDGTWHEIGERVVPGKDPVRFIEMKLQRIGDSKWPAGEAVARK